MGWRDGSAIKDQDHSRKYEKGRNKIIPTCNKESTKAVSKRMTYFEVTFNPRTKTNITISKNGESASKMKQIYKNYCILKSVHQKGYLSYSHG